MLFWLIVIRLCPVVLLAFLKKQKQMKYSVGALLLCYIIGFIIAGWKVILEKKWLSILYIPLSMFPQYLCYGFAAWMLGRCIWQVWSGRVWRRIHFLAVLCVFLGILAENYWNPKILQFFCKIFK